MFFGIKPFTARRARFHQKTRFGSLGNGRTYAIAEHGLSPSMIVLSVLYIRVHCTVNAATLLLIVKFKLTVERNLQNEPVSGLSHTVADPERRLCRGPFKCYVTLFFWKMGSPTHPPVTLITLNLTPLLHFFPEKLIPALCNT